MRQTIPLQAFHLSKSVITEKNITNICVPCTTCSMCTIIQPSIENVIQIVLVLTEIQMYFVIKVLIIILQWGLKRTWSRFEPNN